LPESWTYEDIYLEEMKHVLAALEGKEDYQGSLERERWALATLLAAEESSRKGQRVTIGCGKSCSTLQQEKVGVRAHADRT